jgi:uncharacterized membrane protein HdeD (DUF308 family)
MNKLKLTKLPYVSIGIAMVILANPFLYMIIAATLIDVQNLFGASINRQLASFNSDDPFIQSMALVSLVGFIMIIAGRIMARK